jgi:hypothetical protein
MESGDWIRISWVFSEERLYSGAYGCRLLQCRVRPDSDLHILKQLRHSKAFGFRIFLGQGIVMDYWVQAVTLRFMLNIPDGWKRD